MINGNITDFIDKLYYGEELLFEYNSKIYFIQGWIKDGKACMVLDEQKEEAFEDYLWECKKNSMRDCAEEFLSAKLWENKDFLQIEKEVFWKD